MWRTGLGRTSQRKRLAGIPMLRGEETSWRNIDSPSLLQGVKDGAKKPANVAKTTLVLHEPDESLARFCKRLCEALWVFTPFDLEIPENKRMINSAFEEQAQSDIWKKKKKRVNIAETVSLFMSLDVIVDLWNQCPEMSLAILSSFLFWTREPQRYTDHFP